MTVTEALLEAKLEAVEARTETKFAQLLGKLDVIGERITSLSGDISIVKGRVDAVDGHVRSAKGTISAFVIGTGIAVAALAYSAVQVYQGGMGATQAAIQTGMQLGGPHNEVTTGRAR